MPSTSPDRWPSPGTRTPCYRSRACISQERRQNSPGKQTCGAFSTCCKAGTLMVSTRLAAVTVCNKKNTKKTATHLSPCKGQEWLWSSSISSMSLVCSQSCPRCRRRNCPLLSTKKNGTRQKSEEQFQPHLSEKHNSIDLYKVLSTNRSDVIVSPGLTHICLGRICRNMAPYLVCPCIIYSMLYKQSRPFQLLTLWLAAYSSTLSLMGPCGFIVSALE